MTAITFLKETKLLHTKTSQRRAGAGVILVGDKRVVKYEKWGVRTEAGT
jgi:hypothetical protein